MAVLKDGQAVATGQIISIQNRYGYNEETKKRTEEVIGQKAILLTPDGGAFSVNLDNETANGLKLAPGQTHRWLLAFGVYNGQLTTRFVQAVSAS